MTVVRRGSPIAYGRVEGAHTCRSVRLRQPRVLSLGARVRCALGKAAGNGWIQEEPSNRPSRPSAAHPEPGPPHAAGEPGKKTSWTFVAPPPPWMVPPSAR